MTWRPGRRTQVKLAALAGLAALASAGCANQPPASAGPEQTPAPTQAPPTAEATAPATPTLNVTPTAADANLPDLSSLPQVGQAQADLAERLQVAVGDIRVVAVQAVTWPNGGLGCPKPGVGYTDVLVEGLQITLEYGGQAYDYHSGGSAAPFLCMQPVIDVPVTPPAPET
jgi:hypothetical protein